MMNKKTLTMVLVALVWTLLQSAFALSVFVPGASTANASSPPVVPNAVSPTAANPTLSANPGSLTFQATARNTNPAAQSVTLGATNGTITYRSNISYGASQFTGWLSLSPGSGTIANGTSLPVGIAATTGNLPAGTYNATVTFTDAGNPSDTASVGVTFNLTPAAQLSISPANLGLLFNATAGGANPSSLSASLIATNGSISYSSSISYGAGAAGWLSVNPGSGRLASGGSQPFSVAATTGNLTPGSYTATIKFTDVNNANDTASIGATFNVSAPTPTPTTVAPPVTTTVSTTTATTVATTTPAVTTAIATTPAQTTNTTSKASISGQVLVNGAGASGITLRLDGGNYQQTDSNGNYTFANLAAGSHGLTLMVDPTTYISSDGLAKATDVAGYVHPPIQLAVNQVVQGINFNLQTGVTTTTSTTSPTSVTPTPTPATTTSGSGSGTTTSTASGGSNTTTALAGGTNFAGCQPPSPLPDVLSLEYCISQSPTDPTLFNINFIVYNATQSNIDLSHTVILGLQPGTTVRKTTASRGGVSVSPATSEVSWNNFQLAPNESASLSLYVTKAANSLVLVQSIKVTGVNQTINSPFTAILPALLAQPGVGQDPIYPLRNTPNNPTGAGGAQGQGGSTTQTSVTGLPSTGNAPIATYHTNLSLLTLLLLILLSGICGVSLFWLRLRQRPPRRR